MVIDSRFIHLTTTDSMKLISNSYTYLVSLLWERFTELGNSSWAPPPSPRPTRLMPENQKEIRKGSTNQRRLVSNPLLSRTFHLKKLPGKYQEGHKISKSQDQSCREGRSYCNVASCCWLGPRSKSLQGRHQQRWWQGLRLTWGHETSLAQASLTWNLCHETESGLMFILDLPVLFFWVMQIHRRNPNCRSAQDRVNPS